jgi:hypothetical protein
MNSDESPLRVSSVDESLAPWFGGAGDSSCDASSVGFSTVGFDESSKVLS